MSSCMGVSMCYKYLIVHTDDKSVVWHETLYSAILDADVRNASTASSPWRPAEVLQEVGLITQLYARIEYWLVEKLKQLRAQVVEPLSA